MFIEREQFNSEKKDKILKQILTFADIQMKNKYMRKYTIPLVIMEMQI